MDASHATRRAAAAASLEFASMERREANRKFAMLQSGKITWGDCQSLCLIRNISSGGMMVTLYSPIPEGERVHIDFKSGERMGGRIIWVEKDMTGIEFDVAIDVETVLAQNIRDETRRERARRLRVDVNAMVRVCHEDQDFLVQALDVSQGGIKIEGASIGAIGDDVLVCLSGLSNQPGVIRWQNGDGMGISFNRTLTLDEVAEWIIKVRTNKPHRTAAAG